MRINSRHVPWTGAVVLAALVLSSGAASAAGPEKDVTGEIIAHRGGFTKAPEGTLIAFDGAARSGVDAIEMDVRFTRDDVPVILHDATLERTTNCTGEIAQITYDALLECDAGWGQRVPSLEAVLVFAKAHRLKVYAETKTLGAAEARALAELAERYDPGGDRLVITSFQRTHLNLVIAEGITNVGYIFNELTDTQGWDSDFPVLVPYYEPITPERLRTAHERGQKVISVQDKPVTLEQFGSGEVAVDGLMVHDPGGAVWLLRPSRRGR